MLIQVALILLGLVLVYLILASRGSHGAKASMKVGLILLVVAMIVTVLNPDLTTRLAKFVGVGRGTDLLLYVVTGAFLFYVLTQYLKSQSQRDVTVRLARRIALLEADQHYAAALAGTSAAGPQTLPAGTDDRAAAPSDPEQPRVDRRGDAAPQA